MHGLNVKTQDKQKQPLYTNTTPRTFVSSQQHESKDLRHEEGEAWFHSYLNEDAEQLQRMKQHHVHLRNPENKYA